jgi:hypothetical protein
MRRLAGATPTHRSTRSLQTQLYAVRSVPLGGGGRRSGASFGARKRPSYRSSVRALRAVTPTGSVARIAEIEREAAELGQYLVWFATARSALARALVVARRKAGTGPSNTGLYGYARDRQDR